MAPLLLAGWAGLALTVGFPEDCTVGFTCTVGLAFVLPTRRHTYKITLENV